MTVIGITGGSGAGKTTAMRVLADLGARTIDCDAVYHQLTRSCVPMLDEIGACFPGVVTGGVLDRKALGRIVFNDAAALAALNIITHKYVCEAVDEMLAEAVAEGVTIVAVEAIALIESGIASRCGAVVGVIAPAEQRAERIMAREGISRDYALARIGSQKPDDFFRGQCDYVIENVYPSVAAFAEACRALFVGIL